jgi:hypothetical protein
MGLLEVARSGVINRLVLLLASSIVAPLVIKVLLVLIQEKSILNSNYRCYTFLEYSLFLLVIFFAMICQKGEAVIYHRRCLESSMRSS